MVEALLAGAVFGALALLLAGIRGLAWRHAALLGLGYAMIFWALHRAMFGLDPATLVGDPGFLVLTAALGGMLSSVGWERGQRERARKSESILGIRPPSMS